MFANGEKLEVRRISSDMELSTEEHEKKINEHFRVGPVYGKVSCVQN